MNKKELVDAVAVTADLTLADSERAVNGLLKTITDALTQGDSVKVVGFGSFIVKQRDKRMARNPRTGELITVAATKVPAFKAGMGLKNAINKS